MLSVAINNWAGAEIRNNSIGDVNFTLLYPTKIISVEHNFEYYHMDTEEINSDINRNDIEPLITTVPMKIEERNQTLKIRRYFSYQ